MTTLSSTKFRISLFAAVLALASLSSTASAQARDTMTTANVPFGFEFGSHHFAAGRYTVHMLAEHIMTIQSGSNVGSAITMWDINSKPSAQSKMVFRNYGGRLFLREVWTVGETVHLQSAESKDEKQARRSEIASNHAIAPDVELALLETPR